MVKEWEAKAKKDKDRYTNEMEAFKLSGASGGDEDAKGSVKKRKSDPKKSAVTTTMAGAGFKSKEYISDEDSSDSGKPNKKKVSFCFCCELFKVIFLFIN